VLDALLLQNEPGHRTAVATEAVVATTFFSIISP
jgi:hypothetical protein